MSGAPPCVCLRFCGWLAKARGMAGPGGVSVAVEHIQATPVGPQSVKSSTHNPQPRSSGMYLGHVRGSWGGGGVA
jgi:hypothetical protein